MALPKPSRPEYTTTVPSTGKRIKYQPFTVREEKVLVLAAEGSNTDEITNAISNVLTACITSPADFKIEDLALFDIEYLFLKTRAKSAGEKIKLQIQDPDDPGFVVGYEINVDKIGVKKQEGHTDLIQISETMFVKMRYPDISFFNEGIDMSSVDSQFKVIARCISQIIDGDEVYQSEDMSAGELEDWLDGLTSEKFRKISDFFTTMPKLSHTITARNTNTDRDFSITLEGLADFF
tara:strand:+ start:53 stop:760 length:708 start_codon:yes stop_codon:yes gene_type:complete